MQPWEKMGDSFTCACREDKVKMKIYSEIEDGEEEKVLFPLLRRRLADKLKIRPVGFGA